MTPKVNQELCIGCGTCEAMCPAVFKLNNGKAIVVEGVDYDAHAAKIEETKNACPVQAITVE